MRQTEDISMYRLYYMAEDEDIWQLEYEDDHLEEVIKERDALLSALGENEGLKIVRVIEEEVLAIPRLKT